MERLTNMGFRHVGNWQMNGDNIQFKLDACGDLRNVLYAFISDKTVLYIGKTIQPLKKRMYGYLNPGPTQSTNIKANGFITDMLTTGKTVGIYALPDNGLLHYGGFHVNLAAGLEDSIVATLKPTWNKMGI